MMPRQPGPLLISAALLVLIAPGCSRDVKSGLDPVADSIAANTPITPDTIRSSARNPRRLTMVRDTMLKGSADSASVDWLTASQRMAVGANFLALFSARNLKVFDLTGKHLWSTSRYEFAPGQAANAKRDAMKDVGDGLEDWVNFTFDNDAPAPGALLSAATIEIRGDSIVVMQDNRKVNIYSRAGRSIAITSIGTNTNAYFGGEGSLSASPAGWMLLQRVPVAQGATAAQRALASASTTEFTVNRVSLASGDKGMLLRSLKVETEVVRVAASRGGRGQMIGRALIAANPVARISKGTLYWTTARDFSLDVYDEFGRLKRVINVDTDVVPVSRTLVQHYEEAASRTYKSRAAEGDSSAALWLREVLPKVRELPLPKHRPVIGGLWIGDDGSIAVRRADLMRIPADTTDSLIVDVLDPDGRYRGRVAFEQPGRTILHFTGSEFYLAEKAGTLVRPESNRYITSDSRDRSGRMGTSRYTMPDIVYQRLVRYTIRE